MATNNALRESTIHISKGRSAIGIEDIKIKGVVVTGTPAGLKALQGPLVFYTTPQRRPHLPPMLHFGGGEGLIRKENREFHVNSGICTYAYVKVLNPALTAGISVKPRYRLIATAAP